MKPLVIAVAGKALAGKDTFALGLRDHGIRQIALADNLKTMCQLIFDISPWHTDTQEGKAASNRFEITEKELWKIVKYMSVTHPAWDLPDDTTEPVLHQLPHTVHSVRELLQFVGTDICRSLIQSYHIDVLVRKITRESGVNGWIITDCRFPDERASFKNKTGGVLVLINRPGLIHDTAVHISEASLGLESEYDIVIQNDGTIEDLQRMAVAIFDGPNMEGLN